MRIPAANRFTVFALVVLALAALAAAALLSKPVMVSAGRQAMVLRTVSVSVGLRACPAPGSSGGRDTGLAVLAAAGGSGPGQATVSRLSAARRAGRPLRSLYRPGALSLTGVPATSAATPAVQGAGAKGAQKSAAAAARPGGVMVRATASMAEGLEAEQTSGGVATARCGSPGTDFWFAAPGQQSAGTIELNLMNVDPPHFHVTERGQQALSYIARDPANPHSADGARARNQQEFRKCNCEPGHWHLLKR